MVQSKKVFSAELKRLFDFSATTDLKWFEWIEEHFNVASLKGRKITFEQFKETLQIEQVCFNYRFSIIAEKQMNK